MTKTHRQLWHYAKTGQYPSDVTTQHLINAKDRYGTSALHIAAAHGRLPHDITTTQLKSTIDSRTGSAWDSLNLFLIDHPTQAFRLPPRLFAEDHHVAIKTVNTAIAEKPRIKTAATLWLSQVLATKPTFYAIHQ